MKSKLFHVLSIILVAGTVCLAGTPAYAAKIRVVTTLTDLADFTRAVGGDLVEVHSLATGVEDHPWCSDEAELCAYDEPCGPIGFGRVRTGTRISAWVVGGEQKPAIQGTGPDTWTAPRASYRSMFPKQPNTMRVTCIPMETRTICSIPYLAKTAIRNIYDALVKFAPEHKEEFTRNRDAYLAELDAKIAEWEKETASLKGVKFVAYHEALELLRQALRLGIFRHR